VKDKRISSSVFKTDLTQFNSDLVYRNHFESAKNGIIILDADTGKIMELNPFMMTLLGYNKEHFINKIIWKIDCFKKVFVSRDRFIELLQMENDNHDDLLLETATGLQIHVEIDSNIYLSNG